MDNQNERATAAGEDLRDLEQEFQGLLQKKEGSAEMIHMVREIDDEDDEVDCDRAITEYVVYKATENVLEWRTGSNYHESFMDYDQLEMVHAWLKIMAYKGDSDLEARKEFWTPVLDTRVSLLQFSTVFTHRVLANTFTTSQTIDSLTEENQEHFAFWQRAKLPLAITRADFPSALFPLPTHEILENRFSLAASMRIPEHHRTAWVEGHSASPTLHQLLPKFIGITAVRHCVGNWQIEEGWFELAGQFMLQAVLEAYLCGLPIRENDFNAIFAYGYPGPVEREDPISVIDMGRLFGDGHGGELGMWTEIRKRYIDELLPEPGSGLTIVDSLYAARAKYPIAAFEDNLLSFLEYMHSSLEKPLLVQLEERKVTINGRELPEEELRVMFEEAGAPY